MLFSDTYLTIEKPTEAIFKDKGSKFLAFAYPVENDQQIKEILNQLKKEHHTANHHCYAYRLGADKMNFRANDDGEPNNTAGKPILGQIQSNDLTNVLIVVVRYFGGTLLGVSGLINAYKNSAADVIKASAIIEKQILFNYTIQFYFEHLNDVMKLLKQLDCKITNQQFDNNCEISFSIRKANSEQCEEKLKKIEGLKLEYK
ncbi:MAG: YigZ family protein [Sphingobacteriaceae bacterium]|nr:YigZ family protein [Sphingobacteriaceae bacterium]